MDYLSGQFDDGLKGMIGTQDEISTIDLGEHLTLIDSHEGQRAASLHGSDNDSRPLSGDPEARGGRVGDEAEDLGHANDIYFGKLLPKDAHKVRVALTSEFN